MADAKIVRFFKFLKLRILRQKDSMHMIARGAVIGLMVGMMVPMGGQIIISILLCMVFSGNKLAASSFTFISNPWSVVVLYPFQIFLGAKVVGSEVSENVANGFRTACEQVEFFKFKFGPVFDFLGEHGWNIVIYFLIGGFIIGVLLSAITYPLMIRTVARHHKKREERIIQRKERRRQKLLRMIADGELPEDFPID